MGAQHADENSCIYAYVIQIRNKLLLGRSTCNIKSAADLNYRGVEVTGHWSVTLPSRFAIGAKIRVICSLSGIIIGDS
jgi:hypothetical protein